MTPGSVGDTKTVSQEVVFSTSNHGSGVATPGGSRSDSNLRFSRPLPQGLEGVFSSKTVKFTSSEKGSFLGPICQNMTFLGPICQKHDIFMARSDFFMPPEVSFWVGLGVTFGPSKVSFGHQVGVDLSFNDLATRWHLPLTCPALACPSLCHPGAVSPLTRLTISSLRPGPSN